MAVDEQGWTFFDIFTRFKVGERQVLVTKYWDSIVKERYRTRKYYTVLNFPKLLVWEWAQCPPPHPPCQRPRIFLCPLLVTCWSFHFHISTCTKKISSPKFARMFSIPGVIMGRKVIYSYQSSNQCPVNRQYPAKMTIWLDKLLGCQS